jgi:hypothetical protein
MKEPVMEGLKVLKVTFLSFFVIAACPQSFPAFKKDSRQAGMTSMELYL